MMLLISILIGIISLCCGFFIAKNIIHAEQKKLDESYELEKDTIQKEILNLIKQKENINVEVTELNNHCSIAKNELQNLEEQQTILLQSFDELNNKAKQIANNYYDQTMKIANNRIEQDIDNAEQLFKEKTTEYKEAYMGCMTDLTEQFSKEMSNKKEQLNSIDISINEAQDKLTDIQNKIDIIVESNKRAELDANAKDFYRCCISDKDAEEIHHLREIEGYFRDSRPICKVIWESYYRTPTTNLIDRILGKQKSCGIYKITNLLNNKIYIGQSVGLQDRLTTHIKAGIGIDAPNNKMYQDMKKNGIENFMFEILELCPNDKLNEKEKYWINFYHSQEFGYNITKGGS